MSLLDAIRMMGTTVTVPCESDTPLADDVSLIQKDLATKYGAKLKLPQKGKITPAAGVHGDLELRPISAMLELARGTALSNDPQVTAFARSWSTLRYLGIFAKNAQSQKLHLDSAALPFIGPNQRRVLSEDLGIGFGIIVAKQWCEERTPNVGPIAAIDVDVAIHKKVIPALNPAGKRQPDYILAYPDPQNYGVMIYDLLETKGTVSRRNAKEQLGRAVTQLAGLTVGGNPMTGIAVSTVSATTGVSVMAVDPEELPVTWRPTNEILALSRDTGGRPRKDEAKLDVSAEELFASAMNVGNASLAEFSGQQSLAKRWLPNFDASRRGGGSSEVRRTTESGSFVGTDYVIEIPGTSERVRLYHGVDEQVVGGLRDLDAIAVMEAQSAFARGSAREVNMSSGASVNTRSVSAISSEGAMLEISIE